MMKVMVTTMTSTIKTIVIIAVMERIIMPKRNAKKMMKKSMLKD